jgi:hypothetical protein
VQVAIPFLSIVIVSNIVKVLGIFFTIRLHSTGYIITMGDAVASFLQHPETITKDMCSLKKSELLSSSHKSPLKPWYVRRRWIISVLGGTRAWSVTVM